MLKQDLNLDLIVDNLSKFAALKIVKMCDYAPLDPTHSSYELETALK